MARITGHGGNETLNGSKSKDTIFGKGGNDLINGLAGDDTIFGGGGSDTVNGGDGNDSLFGDHDGASPAESGADQIFGGAGNDLIGGGFGDDFLDAGSGDDNLNGDMGHDTIVGGDGNDILKGYTGADVLTGGAGRDTFSYTFIVESSRTTSTDPLNPRGVDLITDFQQGSDLISLLQIDADGDPATAAHTFTFIGSAAFSGASAQLRYELQADGNTRVEADQNGDMLADFEIIVAGHISFTAQDFIL